MPMEEKIKGGYYIKSRKIKNSPVHKMPPYVREIWDYCLREANHCCNFYGSYKIARGQLFRTYKEIREDLCWYIGYRKMMYHENHTKRAMKVLREARMIDTSKELGGVLITVLNYDFYQDPKNYESTNECTNESTTKEPMTNQCIPANNKNDKNDKNKIYSEDSIELRVSLFLFNHIKKNNPNAKEPNLQSWARDADLLLRVDKRDIEEVKKVIAWTQKDEFEMANILSISKLRKRYDQLILKMNKSPQLKSTDADATNKAILKALETENRYAN